MLQGEGRALQGTPLKSSAGGLAARSGPRPTPTYMSTASLQCEGDKGT